VCCSLSFQNVFIIKHSLIKPYILGITGNSFDFPLNTSVCIYVNQLDVEIQDYVTW
jgi:hypothetical protein